MKALNRTPEESSAKRDAEALSRTTLWIGIVSASSSGMSMRIRRRLSLPSPLKGREGHTVGRGSRPPTRAVRLSACPAQGVRTEASDTSDIALRLREKNPNGKTKEKASLLPLVASFLRKRQLIECAFSQKRSPYQVRCIRMAH